MGTSKKRILLLYKLDQIIDSSNLNREEKERLHKKHKMGLDKVTKLIEKQYKILSAVIKNLHRSKSDAIKENIELRKIYWQIDREKRIIVSKTMKYFTTKIQGNISKENVDKVYQDLIERGLSIYRD